MITKPKKSTLDKLYEKALSVKRVSSIDDDEEIDKAIVFLNRHKDCTRAKALESLDASPEALRRAAAKIGYKFKKPSVKERLLELDASQFTSRELAELIGCTVMSVTNSARDLGIKLKKAKKLEQ